LAAYRRLYGQLPANWVLATGRPADLARLWHFFHVYYAVTAQPHPPARDWWTGRPLTYDVSHSDLLVFLDQTGRERFLVEGGGNTLGGLPPARLAATLTAQGKSNLYHPDPAQTWTVPQLFSVVSWLLGRRV
jgi:protein SCO1/2